MKEKIIKLKKKIEAGHILIECCTKFFSKLNPRFKVRVVGCPEG